MFDPRPIGRRRRNPLHRYRFETKDEFWFVGCGGVGPYFDPSKIEANWVIPLWKELFRRQHELPASVDQTTYISPCHGRESEFTFYGGFASTGPVDDLPEGMLCFRIPAHTYAVGRVQGPREEIGRVYRSLPQWAEQQGRPINRAILWLEIYPDRPVLDPQGPFAFEVWQPVA